MRARRAPVVTRHVGVDVAGFGLSWHDANSKISGFLTPSFWFIFEKVLREVYGKKLFFERAKMQKIRLACLDECGCAALPFVYGADARRLLLLPVVKVLLRVTLGTINREPRTEPKELKPKPKNSVLTLG
jgi:hypothetical protein